MTGLDAEKILCAGVNRVPRQFTEVMILDRSYCHKVAWTSLTVAPRNRNGDLYGYHRDLPIYRRAAKRLCAEWNAQDRRA